MFFTAELDKLNKIQNNILILIVILSIFFIALIYKIVIDRLFQNSLSQSKLGLSSGIENKDGKNICYLYISNKSFSSIIIESFGFADSIKETDFSKKYKTDNGLSDNQKVVVPARDTIKLEVEFDTLYNFYKGYRVDKIEAYVFSSLGNKNKKNAKAIRKQISIISKPIYKEIHKEELLEAKVLKKQDKLEKKLNNNLSTNKENEETDNTIISNNNFKETPSENIDVINISEENNTEE